MRVEFIEHKGSQLAIFWDCYNVECSFQLDEVNGQKLLRLGANCGLDGKPTHRMLLDKERAKILLQVLTEYITKESVPTKKEELNEKDIQN